MKINMPYIYRLFESVESNEAVTTLEGIASYICEIVKDKTLQQNVYTYLEKNKKGEMTVFDVQRNIILDLEDLGC